MKIRDCFHRPRDARSAVQTLTWLALFGAGFAAAIVLIGLYNVSARSGHWPGVSAILHTTFRNAVALRADGEAPADLDTPAMVALGAGHYDSACRGCHASPGEERSATVRAMVPQPPHVTDAVKGWDAQEFHWIVHEGVKMSGMPGWPAARDDDVWPVVAFLRAVPGMTGEDYARLTEKPDDRYCAMCHGATGVSDNPHIPRLDILSETYIANSLTAYAERTRDSGIMAQAMDRLPDESIAATARFFASQRPVGRAVETPDPTGSGGRLATEGGTADIPACNACHGPWPEPLNPAFPSLAGQHAPYMEQQLRLWRDGQRGGSRAAELMYMAARDLTDDDIAALADFYAQLTPAAIDSAGGTENE